MKVLTVVGARPQFVKAAVVSHELRKNHTEVLVHTGQHYDRNMSELFFEEMNIPRPDYNLGISGGTHAEMTGQMMIAIEKVIKDEQPDWVLIYGDTNSTLAAALAAVKLNVRICHMESGNRIHHLSNPEEVNRVCADHVSTKLLACTQSCMDELAKENLIGKAALVGDPMYDAFLEYSSIRKISEIELTRLDGGTCHVPEEYYYLTVHREENTKNTESLHEILKAMNELEVPTVFPVHPRNRERAKHVKAEYGFNNIIITEPVGFLESTAMVKNAKKIVTDSGGLQREAFFACKKCVTVLDFIFWPETERGNRNQAAQPKAEDILDKLNTPQIVEEDYQPFGDGHSAIKIVKALEEDC